MTQQHNTMILGQVSQGKTTSLTDLQALLAFGHAGATVSFAAASVPEAMRRLYLFDLPEINPHEAGGGK
jgi:hypothetical protein